ncbi:MAG: DNA gyrase inhibitor YacG [Candidatus Binatia bacterium]
MSLQEVRCPTCRRVTPWEGNPHRPFCSQRCRLQDLGNWAGERYRVPGPPATPPAEDRNPDDDTD